MTEKQRYPEAQRFLEAFFGPNNQLDLGDIQADRGRSGRLRPLVARLTRSEPLPTILPLKHTGRQGRARVTWYGVARSDQELSGLGEEITAFVGPTWSTFRGIRADLDPADPVEEVVREYTGGAAFKFDGDDSRILEALTLMSRVWEQKASRSVELPRPTGRVLRDFYMALRVGNRESAEWSMQYLADNHRLDAINLLFLRVQLLAELGRWDELINRPDLPTIIKIRRPPAVTHALIRAVYHQELLKYEESVDVEGAVSHFHQQVFPKYGALFATRAGSRNPDVVKGFMMLAVGGEAPNPELRDELLRIPGFDEKDDLYLQQLAARLQTSAPVPVEDPLQRAQKLIWGGAYDLAFEVARAEPVSKAQTQILLDCAFELSTLEAERIAVAAFDSLPAEDQTTLYSSRRISRFIDYLTRAREEEQGSGVAVEPLPANWEGWLSRLYSEPAWNRALAVAQQGAEEWDVRALAEDVGAVVRLVDMLNSCPTDSATALYDALPFLLKFFQKDDGWPRREFIRVYGVLLYLLVMGTRGGDDDLEAFNDLIRALLSLGVDKGQYEELITLADEDLWQSYVSPATLDWVLDLIDTLVLHPCPSAEKRAGLLTSVVTRLTTFAGRVDDGQWKFLRLLVRDLQLEDELRPVLDQYEPGPEVTSVETGDVFERLRGKTVAIYTLTEGVGPRVEKILEEHCPSVTVHLSNDKVGNARLAQISKTADIFVMVTWSAKHAATNFIEDNRPPGLPLLRPAGKGSASMLRALRHHLMSSPTPA